MNEKDKLRVLLAHWIEHNRGHAEECAAWLDRVEDLDEAPAAAIGEAVAAFGRAGEALERALELMGGPVEGPPRHHHHGRG